MRPILVDSSVWIDHFADRRTWATDELNALLGRRTVATADLIVMELLQGVRSRRELRLLEDGLAALPCHDLGGAERARSAAANYRLLRARGMTPRSPIDVLIATFCIEEDFVLLASNRDFTLMAGHLDLALHKPTLS
jgi:predicted nucleic acid-binding protein